ncbi:hypothetical protein [Lactococcus cremoris]|uniref:hypothetical protein n=1 Tax=Lactococcus lactis subsp. cremoris TaxID=1359 RepID=UPI000A74003D|nr:hypothetical protein [Lactococcus cremoris]
MLQRDGKMGQIIGKIFAVMGLPGFNSDKMENGTNNSVNLVQGNATYPIGTQGTSIWN